MSELHWETISPLMRQVMETFGKSLIGKHFYLAGGTALALQLGHRRSFDLDFFSPDVDVPTAREDLRQALSDYAPILANASWGNLVYLAQELRVGFYGYSYPLIAPLIQGAGAPLAGLPDIGLMKMDALLGRASRKDFHDLYAICQNIPLRQLLDAAPQKYPGVRDFEAQVARHLAYFKQAELEEPPPLIESIPWETVKTFFRQQAAVLGKSWLS